MTHYTLPIHITHIDTHHIHFKTTDPRASCPKCAQGQGCGANPWFKGIRPNANITYRLPHSQANPTVHPNTTAYLKIPASLLNRTATILYALALVGFFIGLSSAFLLNLNEGLQLISALSGSVIGLKLSQRLNILQLNHHLQLQNDSAPNLCIPESTSASS